MEMRKLGSQGPEITVVGFGAWEAGGDAWGPNESEDKVVAAMQAGLDAGMSWIDTAEVYGHGTSEELVARAIEGRRGDVLVFTKVAPKPEGSGFRPDQVKQAIRGSLQRLGLDHVDLYQLHWPDPSIPVEDTWGAMAEVQDEGLALHVGVSNVTRSLVERCEEIRHVDSVQNSFSLLNQEDRGDLLTTLADMGVGYLAYSPLALGMLTGAIKKGHRFAENDWRSGGSDEVPGYIRRDNLERTIEKVDRLRVIAERLGTTLAPLALRWVVAQTGVTAAIAGSRSADHTRSNTTAGDLAVDRQTLEEIDAIFA
jgi:aryl-alcohol dehydrogenase-like predicted oxidoreductase